MSYTLDSWTKTVSGAATVTRESTVVNEGSYSAKLTVPSLTSAAIHQLLTGTNGVIYRLTADVRAIAAGSVISFYSYDPGDDTGNLAKSYTITAQNTWESVSYTFVWGGDDTRIRIASSSAGTFYVDNIKLEVKTVTADITALMGVANGLTATL